MRRVIVTRWLALACTVSFAECGLTFAEQPKSGESLDEMRSGAKQTPRSAAEAEYAFAQAAEQIGTRAAFLQWFADDGVMCTPQPANAIETVTQWPESKDTLVWYPSQSYTAGSNDLGYTLGPWTYRSADGKQEVDGTVLSVWRKLPSGAWRVVMDCGVPHAKPASLPKGIDLANAENIVGKVETSPVAEWTTPVAAAEEQFAMSVAKSGLPATLQRFATADVRVLYTGAQTAESLEAASALLTQHVVGKTFRHVFTNQSADGSLGYAWGYVGNSKAAKPTAIYVSVWRKFKASAPWQLVAQTYQPLVERKPKN